MTECQIIPFPRQAKKRAPWEGLTEGEREQYWAGRINELIILLKAHGRYVRPFRSPTDPLPAKPPIMPIPRVYSPPRRKLTPRGNSA